MQQQARQSAGDRSAAPRRSEHGLGRAGWVALAFCSLPVNAGHSQFLFGSSLTVAAHQAQAGVGHKVRLTAPEAGKKPHPKGPLQIIISIAKQRLSVYDNGELVTRAPVSSGMPG